MAITVSICELSQVLLGLNNLGMSGIYKDIALNGFGDPNA